LPAASFGSIATEVTNRSGSPLAVAMCQVPPAFVAMPLLNGADALRTSQTPQ
jgi:hypothetical protein